MPAKEGSDAFVVPYIRASLQKNLEFVAFEESSGEDYL